MEVHFGHKNMSLEHRKNWVIYGAYAYSGATIAG
jgi:hypothetical protein